MKIVALAGGVGGAKLADGLARLLPPEDLTIVVNTGDDFEHLGLIICPDLDTVCYTLAGQANPQTGWGRRDETFLALENLRHLGGPDWFTLGDRDLGTHLERTRRLKDGQPLSQVTRGFCQAWGVKPTILPMSDQPVCTIVDTVEHGELAFQEYFVRRRCEPRVRGFRFAGLEAARPAPGIQETIDKATAIVICPSNPWVSIDPILAVLQLRSPVHQSQSIIAVSPILGGRTVKGPAAKMYVEMGIPPSAIAVARHYQGLVTNFILDRLDIDLAGEIESLGMRALVTDTLMKSSPGRLRLAQDVLNLVETP
ncbi:MAG: 2-phospho-L-lactate transferase [Anaerolineales bacterium]|nr:2-phospho-L-lactate transferase [Anaerolineales bacterium]